MKQLSINSTDKHPGTQVQPRMATGHSAGESPSTSPDANHVFTGHHDLFAEDLSDMEQVEYSERPYLSDEKWFV